MIEKITAVIPTWNFLEHRNNFLELLVKVRDLPIKVILVLDNPDTESTRVAFEDVNPVFQNQVKIFQGKFGSPGAARNAGLHYAETEWITFWDYDDIVFPLEILRMQKCASDSNADYAVGSFEVFSLFDQKKTVHLVDSSTFLMDIALNPGLWRMVFNRKSLANLQFSNALMGEDQQFLIEYEFYKKNVLIYPKNVYMYRKGVAGQATRNQKIMKDLKKVNKVTLDYIEKASLQDKDILLVFYIRQILTLIRRGVFFDKIYAIWQIRILFREFKSFLQIMKRFIGKDVGYE